MENPTNTHRETIMSTVTVKTGPKRHRVQRIVKKHLQQKYLLCGFAIHAFIAAPAYLYGIVVESDASNIRIWSAIIYQAVGQICQSILMQMAAKECHNSIMKEINLNRNIFLFATILLCCALTICGSLFTSAWITMTPTTQIIAILIYGIFGGIGSSIIFCRTHLIIEAVRPKEDLYVRKTIHLCGEAFCQLFLSFVFTSLRTLYGTAQTLVLMASMMINFIPLSLLITRHREEVTLRIPTAIIPPDHHRFGNLGLSEQFPRSSSLKSIDKLDGIEMQQKFWKNPLANPQSEMHCNYVSIEQEDYYTYSSLNINENGVDIMDIIPEEDENTSVMRSSTMTIDNHSRIISIAHSISSHLNETNEERLASKASLEANNVSNGRKQFLRMQKISTNLKKQIFGNCLELFIYPLRKALIIYKLYPAALLQSADIFSYVMCLTVLPGIALNLHALKFAEIPFLFSLIAFPWMCFALMTPRFGAVLLSKNIKWHAVGCIAKALALTSISFSTSKILLSVASVLLGFGQAVSLFLQESVIECSMPKAQWLEIKYPLHATSGIFILIWGSFAHLTVSSFGFQAAVGLSSIIYTLSILIWFVVFFCIRF